MFKGTCVYRELHQKKRTGVHKSSEYNGKRSLFVSRRDNALRYSLSRISFFFYVFISILHQIPAVKHDCKRPIIHKGNFHIGTKLPLLDHRDFFAYILYRYYSRKQQRQIQPNSRRNSRKYGIKVKGKRT